MLRPFWLAVQFLTRIPVPAAGQPSDEELGRSMLAYPVVGLLLGGMLVIIDQLFTTVEPLLVAALLLVFWVLVTGALHLDGLADSADAWLGGHGDRERTLSIMKDPCSGPAGVSLIVLVLVGKFAALSVIVQAGPLSALLLAPLLGRAALIALFLTVSYVRPGGVASALAAHLPRRQAHIALLIVLLTAILIGAWWGVVALLVAALTLLALRSLMVRRLGGTTGDTAGAVVEIVELVVLFALAAV